MKDTEFLYATMRVRAKEANLLTPQQLERMIDVKSPAEAGKILADAGYGEVQAYSLSDIERALIGMRESTLEFIREISPCAKLADVFALKYDFHNIKTLLKASLTGKNADALMAKAGTLPTEKLVSAVQKGDTKSLPELMAKAIEEAKETLSHTGDAQLSDFVLDRAYFEMLHDAAKEAESEFLDGYVRLMCDAANLRAAVRNMRRGEGAELLKKGLVSGGNISEKVFLDYSFDNGFSSSPLCEAAALGAVAAKGNGSLTEFEKAVDNALINYMKDAKYAAFDERPLIAYIAARDAEAMAIRIIMAGKLEELSPDEIRRRLRG